MRRYAYAPDAYDQPPDTDPAPVPCTNCGRLGDCDCGDADEPDEWDEGNALPEEGR
jgi:hypothetical protein